MEININIGDPGYGFTVPVSPETLGEIGVLGELRPMRDGGLICAIGNGSGSEFQVILTVVDNYGIGVLLSDSLESSLSKRHILQVFGFDDQRIYKLIGMLAGSRILTNIPGVIRIMPNGEGELYVFTVQDRDTPTKVNLTL